MVTGAVAALRAEARCLEAAGARSHHVPLHPLPRLLVRTSGIGCERAAQAASELLRAGVGALLCFGVGGALDPTLRCGEVVLATAVLRPSAAALPTEAHWLRWLQACLAAQGCATIRTGALLTCDEIIASVRRKRELFGATGALAVDMESAAVAQVALRAGVPFVAMRAIADTAADELPPILQQLLAGRSGAAPEAVQWWPLLRAPASWPALVGLGRRYRCALRTLTACARAGVACPPLSAGVGTNEGRGAGVATEASGAAAAPRAP